jgi:hypothetical protein
MTRHARCSRFLRTPVDRTTTTVCARAPPQQNGKPHFKQLTTMRHSITSLPFTLNAAVANERCVVHAAADAHAPVVTFAIRLRRHMPNVELLLWAIGCGRSGRVFAEPFTEGAAQSEL